MLALRSIERLFLYALIPACIVSIIFFFHHSHERYVRYSESQASDLVEMRKLAEHENSMNIGKTLPAGILVKDAQRNTIDLREAVRGPTVLLKIAMDCHPCIETIAWLRDNAGSYEGAHHVSIVVLAVRRKEYPKAVFPPEVRVLYTSADLASGYLGGSLTPAEFMFDGHQKLVARDAGYDVNMAKKLRFRPGVH